MSEMDQEDLAEEVARLTARFAELEERVAQLESGPVRARPATVSSSSDPIASGGEDLIAAMSQAFAEIGEADAGALRQHLVKKGWASLGRSDVNKALYANQTRFEIARQEGAKPVWKAKDEG